MTRVVGLDIETTGLDAATGDKIIEIAMITMENGVLVDKYCKRVDPKRPIDPKAQAVHGISYAELVGCPTFEEIADEVHERIAAADRVIIHNADFDAPFVAIELNNCGKELPSVDVFCTMQNARWATPDGKYPKLGELCFAMDVDYDPDAAHAALYDVGVMLKCYFRALRQGFFKDLEKQEG